MPSAERQRQRERRSRGSVGPDLHVKVAHASADLGAASSLVKPAILYADKVTVYSPAASLLRSVEGLAEIKGPGDRVAFIMHLMEQVPELRRDHDLSPDLRDTVRVVASMPRPLARRAMRATGVSSEELDEVNGQLDGLQAVWEDEIPEAIEKALEITNAGELWTAIERGAVEVADITEGRQHQAVAESVRAASSRGRRTVSDDLTDEIIGSLVARIIEMVSEPTAFPLFDPDATGLLRSLEREAGLSLSPAAVRQGSEIDSAARFMGFLPYFTDLSMDEVLDLRDDLRPPLTRFRAAMASIARDLQARQIDPSFPAEVEAGWRGQVAPALQEIEEALESHGLRRQVVSTAIGNPRRVLAGAGAAFAATHVEQFSLSGLLAAAATAGVPALDIAAQSMKATRDAKRGVESQSFYFRLS